MLKTTLALSQSFLDPAWYVLHKPTLPVTKALGAGRSLARDWYLGKKPPVRADGSWQPRGHIEVIFTNGPSEECSVQSNKLLLKYLQGDSDKLDPGISDEPDMGSDFKKPVVYAPPAPQTQATNCFEACGHMRLPGSADDNRKSPTDAHTLRPLNLFTSCKHNMATAWNRLKLRNNYAII
ncbi:hypothetical protein P7K49_037732 [Saguinus oedipus]|uniref:Uncharacterized protein n=1 Tax=Saguinus oedipus TaxID=9490 RepID=A0ABQ9TIZ6_SAGOE|nr:hypothetical protein P7K49_037732 [Saguinus oedipus]